MTYRHYATVLALLGLALATHAGTQQLVLKELLNQPYAHEMVTYPFTAPKGACAVDSLQLTGPTGPQTVQLSEVTCWPNTAYVHTARLSFIVDTLAPLTNNTYTLSYSRRAVPPVTTDLSLHTTPEQVEVSTTHLGVRMLLGKASYATPQAAAQVPGPLTAMRLEQGAWAGGSTLYGADRITSWSGELQDHGPLFARVQYVYQYASGNTTRLTAQVIAGDSGIRWEENSANDCPDDGLELRFPAAPGLQQATSPAGTAGWGRERTLKIPAATEPICKLSPRTCIADAFPDYPSAIVFHGADNELQLRSRDAGAWVTPSAPFTYGGFSTWKLEIIPQMWNRWQRMGMPVSYGPAGVIVRLPLTKGTRKWSVSSGASRIGERLDVVKDMVLEWAADPKISYPHLFIDKAEEEAAWQREKPDTARLGFLYGVGDHYYGWKNEGYLYGGGTAEAAKKAKIVALTHEILGLLGNFDMMRHGNAATAMYDGLIGTDLLTAQDKALFRAQLAAMGYALADPSYWNAERGYLSGNPNMSCSNICTLGVVACEIPDHPLAKQWAAYANGWMNVWLANEVGPNGEWQCEGIHYGQGASAAPMVAYAIAAKRAGFSDFVDDPRLKKMVLYLAKQYSPRDPQRHDARVSPPVGRGLSGETFATFGVMARATADRDPAYSRTMQWMWAQTGYPWELGDWRLGGFEPWYLDKRLPMQAPAWGSEHFPTLGVVLRSGFNTPSEHYLNLVTDVDSQRNLDVWTPQVGALAQWYAFGKPLSQQFTFAVGYAERHELLRDGVLPAHNYDGADHGKAPFGYYTTTKPEAFSTLPRQDYVAATFTVTNADTRDWFPAKMPAWPKVTAATEAKLRWTRQALFVKDDVPQGPHYLVLRDTTRGGQPTQWQFWSLSEKIGTPAQTKDPAFLAAKPGKAILPAGLLPPGDRYTALGQFGVDLEYFIAAPADTPRNTLRYGGLAQQNVAEYEDLLHLQLPGDGAYYVALVPHLHNQPAPDFAALDGGKIIKVSGAFGTDYAFLTSEPSRAGTEMVTFSGTAASVQQRANTLVLTLGDAGEIHCREYGLFAAQATSLRVDGNTLTLTLAGPTGAIRIYAPAGFALNNQPGVSMKTQEGTYTITVPADISVVTLVKK